MPAGDHAMTKPVARATLIDLKSGHGHESGAGGEPDEPLYEKRRQIYPKLAHGRFRSVKWLAMIVMLGAYYVVPWLRWPRGEGRPDQAVLADFAGKRLYFFGIEIWPQEVYYITGLLILASLGLFLVTSLFGRVWCGYACPQTVWTDLYIWVERLFEGDRAARMRLAKAPMSANKAIRKTAKHVVWLVIAFVTGGAFIMYFHDAPSLAVQFFAGQAPVSAYAFSAILTFTTYILAGTMREQVCTYMCPWPRIQGALTDEHALNVTYRYDRGEPRAPLRKGEDMSQRGHCIDCKQCVQVCPMGIDIREGSQLECIHCALCIDACDDIMKKVGLPTGLIAYDTVVAVEARAAGKPYKYRLIRVRTILYAVLAVFVAGLMAFGLSTRSTFEINVIKDRSPPYITLADGSVRNGYEIKIVNKSAEARTLNMVVSGLEGATLKIAGQGDIEGRATDITIAANGVSRYRLMVTHKPDPDQRRAGLNISLTDAANGESHDNPVPFSVPGQGR